MKPTQSPARQAPPDHRPRKRFGQHFVRDPNIIARMVEAVSPQPDDTVVEIGPGKGALTRALLKELNNLHVVELDRDLAARLVREFPEQPRLRVHCADALRFDFSALVQPGQELRVVGNLPYNISTPLLFHLLGQEHAIRDMHFMLQREVVDRIIASPGTADYGRLSVMVQLRCKAEKLFTVNPSAFSPKPRVWSAVVRLCVRKQSAVEVMNSEVFAHVVARAFTHRRKTLRNSMKGVLTESQILSAHVDPGARPGTLNLSQFAALANQVER